MRVIATILALLYACIASVSAAKTFRGVATAYSKPGQMNKTGRNACGFNPRSLPKKYRTYFAAVNEGDFNKSGRPCGKCVQAKGRKGTVYAKIVDICPKKYCKSGHVDFSTAALQKATGYSWDKKPISWKIVKCP